MRLKPCSCWTSERGLSTALSGVLKYQSDASALWFALADSIPEALHVPLSVGVSFFGPVKPPQTNSSPALTFQTPVLMIRTLTNAATIPACARCDFALFMLEKTRTDYPSLDLWVVQWHTGAAMELHNEALWRQRQASLAAPHPGYLICERSLTGAVAVQPWLTSRSKARVSNYLVKPRLVTKSQGCFQVQDWRRWRRWRPTRHAVNA